MKEINTKDIQTAILRYFNHHYQLLNSYIFGWESDYFGMTASNYFYEVEVKISKSDFRADFKKKTKHQLLGGSHKALITLKGETTKEDFGTDWGNRDVRELSRVATIENFIPHKFFYASPKGLLKIEDIPDYAGLIEIGYKYGELQIEYIKKAPFLHKRDIRPKIQSMLLEKFYYKMQEQRGEVFRLKSHIANMEERYMLSGMDETEIKKTRIMFNY